MGASTESTAVPDLFRRVSAEVGTVSWRPELVVEDIPAPQRIAPYALALTADVLIGEREIGSGRMVLLHDPAGNAAWQGTFRCVTFARADIDPEMVTDPLLAQVGWSWLTDALAAHGADFSAPSGTVTSVASESFGGMAEDPARAEVEVRASWTPEFGHGPGAGPLITPHLEAWGELMCTAAGLPPLPPGVVSMPARRSPGARSRFR